MPGIPVYEIRDRTRGLPRLAERIAALVRGRFRAISSPLGTFRRDLLKDAESVRRRSFLREIAALIFYGFVEETSITILVVMCS